MKLFGRSWAKVVAELDSVPLREYLAAPAPDPKIPLDQARLLAVDVETTGLNPAQDQLLSIGFVPIDGPAIDLGGAGAVLIRPSCEVGDSAQFHGLTDDSLAQATSPAEALDTLFTALRGRVLVAHHATIETGFVGRACNGLYGLRPRFAVVDTMSLQFRLLSQGFDDEPPPGSLRLWAARSQYGLPRYAAHDALTDALACAELYLAQIAELQAGKAQLLKSVLKS